MAKKATAPKRELRRPATKKRPVRRPRQAPAKVPILFFHACEDDGPVHRIAADLLASGHDLRLMGDSRAHGGRRTALLPSARAIIYWSRASSAQDRIREATSRFRKEEVPQCTVILEDSSGESVTSRVPAYIRVDESADHTTGWMVENWDDVLKLVRDFASGALRWAKISGDPL